MDVSMSWISPAMWIIFVVVFIISYNYIVKEQWKGLPPGPPALPLVGSLPFLGMDIREPLRKMAAKYGDVFTIYLGMERVVVINGYETFKEAFLKNGHVFAGRAGGFLHTAMHKHQGIISSYGQLWHDQRRYALHLLRDLGFGRPIIENRILDEVEFFIKELQKQNGPFHPQSLLQRSVANVIISVVQGKRMEYDDPAYIRLNKTMEGIAAAVGTAGILNVFPFVRHLPGDLFHAKKIVKHFNALQVEYQNMVGNHKSAQVDDEYFEDFIGAYLQKIEKEKGDPKSTFHEKQLCSVIHDLFFAGAETASTALTWAIVYISKHPNMQDTVYAEISDVIGKGGVPSMRHRSQMPFTEAFISELLRISDIVPVSAPHTVMEDIAFKGYFLPKGTTIMPNISGVLLDPQLWPNPDEFQPERFLDADGKIKRRDEHIAFMIGKRACLGENLGRMEIFLYFVSMLIHFKFRFAPGSPVPGSVGIMGITHVPMPFQVIVENRE